VVGGTYTSTSTAAVAGFLNPVTWTFAGGLAITDTSTYTAGLSPFLNYVSSGSKVISRKEFTHS
jgi:hypothetical protein